MALGYYAWVATRATMRSPVTCTTDKFAVLLRTTIGAHIGVVIEDKHRIIMCIRRRRERDYRHESYSEDAEDDCELKD